MPRLLEAVALLPRGDEIIALSLLSRQMPGSEDRIQAQTLVSWKFRDGKLIRVEALAFGPAEVPGALEAAGLSE